MNRRAFIAKIAIGLLAAPPSAWPQQARKAYRIGIPGTGINTRSAPFYVAFEQRLRELGWIDGQNVTLQYKGRNPEELQQIITEMVRDQVDVILVSGAEGPLEAAVQATRSIPIVMIALNFDPLEKGYVANLGRPGGNVTGIFARNPEAGAKQLDLLKQAFPNATRVGVLWEKLAADQLPAIEAAAARLHLEVESTETRPPYDFERAFATLRERHADAVLVVGSPISYRERDRIAQLALRYRLPAVGGRSGAEAGNLIGFGFDLNGLYRRAAEYIDRILRGAKPADLPIEQPAQFELVINLKTAKALGLTIPQSLLLRADAVIQ